QMVWLDRLRAEYANIRAALRRSINDQDALTSLRFCAALWRFWSNKGYLGEGRDLLRAALALEFGHDVHAPESMRAKARALHGAGALAFRQSDLLDAETRFEQSLEICEQIGDIQSAARSEASLGEVFVR